LAGVQNINRSSQGVTLNLGALGLVMIQRHQTNFLSGRNTMGFQQGLSGLNASSKALDTIGNNIANSGTVGFKTGSTQFADVFAASLNGAGAAPVGLGTKVSPSSSNSPRATSVTNNPLDIAINGGGFFQMDDGNGGTLYSRNGQFQLDKDGYIVNAQGLQLKGIMANGVIPPGSPAVPLRLFDPSQSLTGSPQATGTSTGATGVQANVNLDSRGWTNPVTPLFNYADPTSYNQSTARRSTTASATRTPTRCISSRPAANAGTSMPP
jgi:flagellar hook protein FlgE